MERTIFQVTVYKTKARKTVKEVAEFSTLLEAETFAQSTNKPTNIKQLYIQVLNGREFVFFNAGKGYFANYN